MGSVGAYLLVLYAFQVAPAGRVSTLREASVLVGLMLSGERPARAVWTGAILVNWRPARAATSSGRVPLHRATMRLSKPA